MSARLALGLLTKDLPPESRSDLAILIKRGERWKRRRRRDQKERKKEEGRGAIGLRFEISSLELESR